jgi:hypothetical protein
MKEIFVFGSNLSGIHAAGAAYHAHQRHGAVWRVGEGRTGSCYAIPTKMGDVATTRSMADIKFSIHKFLVYATDHSELEFKVTRIGCGLAGLKDYDIAPMFANAPDNCLFDQVWEKWLPNAKFWGTF